MRCDVLVVGAGPAGAAAALALARRGFDVCMIDRTERSVRTVGEALHGVARAC
jgi:flavin-dependent dehydrogenase